MEEVFGFGFPFEEASGDLGHLFEPFPDGPEILTFSFGDD